MRKPRCDGQKTRKALLEAACELFAKNGYYEATTIDICKKAQTNPAAVNYYFESKQNLYVESWKYAYDLSLQNHPLSGGIPEDASAEERLFGRISSLLRRIMDPDGYSFDIVHKEMVNPTGFLREAMNSKIEPFQEGLKEIIREILGDCATTENVDLCRHSIMAQCFSPMLGQRHRKKKHSKGIELGYSITAELLEKHIYQFSLAGIKAIKEKRIQENQ